jgi:hypothetical protein
VGLGAPSWILALTPAPHRGTTMAIQRSIEPQPIPASAAIPDPSNLFRLNQNIRPA